ncbi:MAG TPA: pyrroline-5-carboxylate reductase [Nitratidesulfovibrio sp.]|nr:pyrroline-5-carboxylate reductase [Nitratidesulfovibrio sp.]
MSVRSTEGTVLGCIGCGNMGAAILRGLSGRQGLSLLGYNPTPAKVLALADAGVRAMPDAAALAAQADVVLLGVKPYLVSDVLRAIAPSLTPDKVVVSIASGVSIAAMKAAMADAGGLGCPVVRVMPNTPAMVGKGVYALCFEDPALDAPRRDLVRGLFEAIGTAIVLPEGKFTAFTAVVGCGPAYVFYFMEAVTEVAVTLGFTRQDATELVKGLFSGSVALAEQSGTHLSVLREQVCSPAGNTIAAMNQLDREAVRGRIMDAVLAAYTRGLEMEK